MLFRSDRKSTRLNSSHTLISYALPIRSEEHTSELQSHSHLVCRLLLEKKKNNRGQGVRARARRLPRPDRRVPVGARRSQLALAVTSGRLPCCPACALVFFFFNDTATPEIYPLSLHAALPINDTATTEIYTLSLHDALPISVVAVS